MVKWSRFGTRTLYEYVEKKSYPTTSQSSVGYFSYSKNTYRSLALHQTKFTTFMLLQKNMAFCLFSLFFICPNAGKIKVIFEIRKVQFPLSSISKFTKQILYLVEDTLDASWKYTL